MFPATFEYHRAQNLEEALNLLQEHPDAKLLAGGHSLIPMMKLRLAQPPALIDIGRVAELSGITHSGNRLRIGALSTHAEIASSSLVRNHAPLLAEAASQIADPAVRNKGTIGGNLGHADPGSDLPAVIVALDGVIHFRSPTEDRQAKAGDFFLDLMMTDLRPGEILSAVEVPAASQGSGSCYLKFEHPASGYAVCGAAAAVELDSSGNCQKCRLVFNGVKEVPWDASDACQQLIGTNLQEQAVKQALDSDLGIAEPMGDTYASGAYRIHLARIYGRRALLRAGERARE